MSHRPWPARQRRGWRVAVGRSVVAQYQDAVLRSPAIVRQCAGGGGASRSCAGRAAASYAFAGGETLHVPILHAAIAFGPLARRLLAEQPSGVPQQQAVVAADGHDHVLVVFHAEVDEGGVQIEGVPHHHVEEAAIEGETPSPTAVWPRFPRLRPAATIPRPTAPPSHAREMAYHAAVIVLDHLLSVDGERPGLALPTAAFPAGEKTRGRPRPRSTSRRRWPTPCSV